MPADPPPSIGRSGAYAKGVARREEILDRAIEVFQARGSQGTSLRKIAEALGVSHAALLHYFDSREQLLIAVYDRAENRGDDTNASRAESAVDVMVRAAVVNVGVPGIVELYSTLLAAALEAGNDAGREYFASRFERVRGELTARLRQERAEGRVRDDLDLEHVAALIIAASDGLQIQWLLEPTLQLRETLETLAKLLAPQAEAAG